MSTNDPLNTEIKTVLDSVENKTPLRYEAAGSVFEGATTDEVIQKLLRSQEHANSRIRDLTQGQTQAQTELEQLRQSHQAPAPPANQKDADNAEYWRLWSTDPIAANRFAMAKDLGVSPDQVPGVLRQQVQTSAVSMQNQAGEEFTRRNPDFPASPEASQALVQHMQRKYSGRGLPRDAAELADRLEVTYSDMVRQNLLQPADIQVDATVGQRRPIPALGNDGSGGNRPTSNSTDWEMQAWSMPLDKLRQATEELYAKSKRR